MQWGPGDPPNTRLTVDSVRRARGRYLRGEPQSAIATAYGVSPSAVFSAIHGRTWAWVDRPGPVPIRRKGGRRPALPPSALARAREMRRAGMSLRVIGAELGVHASTVHRALWR